MKRVSTVIALALGAFATFSSAAQIKGLISGYAPGNVEEIKTTKGVDQVTNYNSDISWSVGAEFLTNPAAPVLIGGGLGFMSMQQDGGDYIVIPSVPLWGSFGLVVPQQNWVARPYFLVRVGYLIPTSQYMTWWNKPLNFHVGGNIGVQLPYHMGVEFNCTYLTMNKYYKRSDVNFSLRSLKIGGSITVHFDLFNSSSDAGSSSAVKDEFFVEPATADNSSETSSMSENTETTSSYEDPYSVYGETSTEEPAAEEPVAESAAEEPATETPAAEPAAEESAAEETAESATEESEASATEESAAEAPAEEPAVEAAAEPAAEPVAEPAPAPKAAAKKAPAKKKAAKKAVKKAPAKKAAKKTTKKPVAKGKKKK